MIALESPAFAIATLHTPSRQAGQKDATAQDGQAAFTIYYGQMIFYTCLISRSHQDFPSETTTTTPGGFTLRKERLTAYR